MTDPDGSPDDRRDPGSSHEADCVPVPSAFEGRATPTDDDRDEFAVNWPAAWARAGDALEWERDYDAVLSTGDDGGPPFEWFAGGELNACANCVDRHLPERADAVALEWNGHIGESRTYTYRDLHREVNAVAAGLRDLGVDADDVVTTYLPAVPAVAVVMLACARLGAVHNVVFAGFSADALATRMERAGSRYLVTSDGYYRRGEAVDQRRRADNATMSLPYELDATVVVDRLGTNPDVSRDDRHAYDALVDAYDGERVAPVPRAATDPLFRIYTSGTTGEPKSVTHTTGGYLAQVAWSTRRVLDVTADAVVWSTADPGWITGHSYGVYGPLALGATTVLTEWSPDAVDPDRPWALVEDLGVEVLYTAPTVVRSFAKWGAEHPAGHDLSSLRVLGSVGEPFDAETWEWYYEHVGGGDCPVVDTWWQTETGAVLLSTLPGVDEARPGAVGGALAGVGASVRDASGEPTDPGQRGWLTIDRPWPAMARELATATDWGARVAAESGVGRDGDWWYRVGDEAFVDADGYVTVLGRADDVVNVDGRRFSTGEIEHALVEVAGVAEAAVIARDDPDSGNALVAYVTTADERTDVSTLREALGDAVAAAIGAGVRLDQVVFTPDLPKTRSGKIMRRLLEDIANGEGYGDTSALRNPEVVGELEARHQD
ncbi:acetate--CoA ligase [Halorubellus sp. JP-L1]|uniref:acetate--CoA ligase n=1 Tax=Halorubellus sp. JP-L1 TaxID=2715753 RepID=UPI00140A577D|nr:acetate--CoA ligase [Halorubellus sp. JP-L1]NHN43307.1 acetate--CoA ligase [Halorubellus sp. JP-L1]